MGWFLPGWAQGSMIFEVCDADWGVSNRKGSCRSHGCRAGLRRAGLRANSVQWPVVGWPAERRTLRVESQVDQDVIVEVDLSVAVEVSIHPSGSMVVEAVVRADVIVEVDATVEVGLAVVRVLHEDGGGINGL